MSSVHLGPDSSQNFRRHVGHGQVSEADGDPTFYGKIYGISMGYVIYGILMGSPNGPQDSG